MIERRIYPGLVVAAALAAPAAAQSQPELYWGGAVTSNYISDGLTQSDDRPAVQAYVEVWQGIFYGGIWTSTVDFDSGDNVEIDLYAGVQPTFGDLEVDLSYYRYIYDNSGDCCGEFQLGLAYPMADQGAIAVGFEYDPEDDSKWGETALELNITPEWIAGGTLGTDFGTDGYDDDLVAWDAGVKRSLGEIAWVDVRYYDSNLFSARGVVTIGFDF
jgi:uncharacterized protein (TIGR02001 family)